MKKIKWNIGLIILRIGYKLRGEIPQKNWKLNNRKNENLQSRMFK